MALSIESINSLAKQLHNPSLIEPTESPNANTIWKIWSDGSITYEKGGWAYGQRSVFDHMYKIYSPVTKSFQFPLTTNTYDGILTYAIVTKENAEMIRKQMVDFIKSQ